MNPPITPGKRKTPEGNNALEPADTIHVRIAVDTMPQLKHAMEAAWIYLLDKQRGVQPFKRRDCTLLVSRIGDSSEINVISIEGGRHD